MNVIAQTLLSPDKITRKRSFHDYENVRSTSHNIGDCKTNIII